MNSAHIVIAQTVPTLVLVYKFSRDTVVASYPTRQIPISYTKPSIHYYIVYLKCLSDYQRSIARSKDTQKHHRVQQILLKIY